MNVAITEGVLCVFSNAKVAKDKEIWKLILESPHAFRKLPMALRAKAKERRSDFTITRH
jgi:hypothetical protein